MPVAVYSSASLQKNKGAHSIGIVPEIAASLGAWLRTRTPGQPIFRGNAFIRTAEMLRHDLTAAGVPYLDAAGEVFDSHNLRVQRGYFMRMGGVSFVAAVEILDHSEPKLTAKICSRFDGELGAEMAKVPVPPGMNACPSLGATLGSDGIQPVPIERKSVNTSPLPGKKIPRKS